MAAKMTELGSAIRLIRTRLGQSQAEFAHSLGVQRNSVSRWEVGRAEPSPLSLLRLHDLSLPEQKPLFAREIRRRLQTLPGGWTPAIVSAASIEELRPFLGEMGTFDAAIEKLPRNKKGEFQNSYLFRLAKLLTGIMHESIERAALGVSPEVDDSLIDILRMWLDYGPIEPAPKHFRDAAAFLRVKMHQIDNDIRSMESNGKTTAVVKQPTRRSRKPRP
jgi:putative transcriptional regulator